MGVPAQPWPPPKVNCSFQERPKGCPTGLFPAPGSWADRSVYPGIFSWKEASEVNTDPGRVLTVPGMQGGSGKVAMTFRASFPTCTMESDFPLPLTQIGLRVLRMGYTRMSSLLGRTGGGSGEMREERKKEGSKGKTRCAFPDPPNLIQLNASPSPY